MSLRLRHHPTGALTEPASIPVLGADVPPHPAWLRRPVLGRHADRDLRGHLERELHGMGSVLHDVRLTGTTHTLDHLVVAPSGIWLIDVVHIHGRITKRDIGTRVDPELRLVLDGTDRSALVDELGILRQTRHAIAAMKFGIEVQTATCLVDATWPMSARPFQVRNHWIVWPRSLTDKIRSSGLVPIRIAHDIAGEITRRQTLHTGDTGAISDSGDAVVGAASLPT